jgi:uncharacterized membrane protein
MIDRTLKIFVSMVFIGGCFLVLACGDATPGNGAPDGGTGNEVTPYTCPVTPPTVCPAPAPSYADVAPIFESRCVTCHAGKPQGSWALTSYSHVASWQDTIRTNVRDCTMPPTDAGVPAMPLEERLAILTWIHCGLPR